MTFMCKGIRTAAPFLSFRLLRSIWNCMPILPLSYQSTSETCSKAFLLPLLFLFLALEGILGHHLPIDWHHSIVGQWFPFRIPPWVLLHCCRDRCLGCVSSVHLEIASNWSGEKLDSSERHRVKSPLIARIGMNLSIFVLCIPDQECDQGFKIELFKRVQVFHWDFKDQSTLRHSGPHLVSL